MDIVEGAKLWWIVSSLCIGLLLSSLESTIVSTALVSIASSFDNYGQSNWIVIVYLLTYSSFLVVFARLSDVTGRKSALITSLCVFTSASLACGLSHTLTQLIVFRSLQGIGGSGIYALTMVVVAEIAPKRHLGRVSALVNVVFVVASAVGPVVGGAISTYSNWRWCFYLNVPSGAAVIIITIFWFPPTIASSGGTLKASFRRVDWIGLTLCLGASITIILPIQEGGSLWAWNSDTSIILIVVGGFCWATFAGWEIWLSSRPRGGASAPPLLPMIPHHVVFDRVVGTCIVTSFLTGLTFTSIVVYLPQRFQAVNDFSPVRSGVNILPVLLISAFGATLSGLLLGTRNVCSYLIVAGNALQLAGLGLLSTLSTEATIPATAYGFQAVLGFGLGTTLSASFILARIEARREDIASTVGTITQLRVYGGVVGVVICRVAQSSYLRHHLSQHMTSATLDLILSSVASISILPTEEAIAVRKIFGSAFNWQWRILTYIAAANLLVAFFTFRLHPKPIGDPETALVEEQGTAPAPKDGSTANTNDISSTPLEMERQN